MSSSSRKFFTIAEAADLFRCTPKTLWVLCKEDKIPATKPFGQWLIPAEYVEARLADGANNAEKTA